VYKNDDVKLVVVQQRAPLVKVNTILLNDKRLRRI